MRDIEPPTWKTLHEMARPRSIEIDAAFHWGLDVLERWLGENWPDRCYQAGGIPPELIASQGSLRGLAMLIDLAGGMELLGLRPGMGKFRRALKRSPNWETIASTRSALRLAVAGLRAGLEPELEHGQPPMDLLLSGKGFRVAAEIKTLRRTDLTIEVDRFLDELTLQLLIDQSARDVVVVGEARQPLDPAATEALVAKLIDAASLVRKGLESPVIWVGQNRFEVRAPRGAERPGSRIAMPPEDLWRRTASRILAAADQISRSGADWLVIESLDNLWLLTPWSRDRPANRAQALADASRELVAGKAHVHGLVFTDGAATTSIGSGDEDVSPEPGTVFVRRRIDYVRSRQTIVVALNDDALSTVPIWKSILDAEARFADWALPRFGLVAPPELSAGTSRL